MSPPLAEELARLLARYDACDAKAVLADPLFLRLAALVVLEKAPPSWNEKGRTGNRVFAYDYLRAVAEGGAT